MMDLLSISFRLLTLFIRNLLLIILICLLLKPSKHSSSSSNWLPNRRIWMFKFTKNRIFWLMLIEKFLMNSIIELQRILAIHYLMATSKWRKKRWLMITKSRNMQVLMKRIPYVQRLLIKCSLRNLDSTCWKESCDSKNMFESNLVWNLPSK